jgi:hypothetical protein
VDTRDIVDIQQLEAFCHHAVDHDDQSLLHLAFTDDAVFDARQCGGPRIEGLKGISEFFALGKPPHPPSHHMTNCWIREEDGRVKVWMKFMVMDRETGRMHTGDNNDWVVRTDEGWRIRERVARMRYPGEMTVSDEVRESYESPQ